MRVFTIAGATFGLAPDLESDWAALTRQAELSVEEGHQLVPSVWFRSNGGMVGAIPVSKQLPIVFTHTDDLELVVDVITHLGTEAEIRNLTDT